MSNIGTYPELLIIEPGETVECRFARLEKGHTKSGEARAIAILSIDGAERSLWLHETALRGQFREKRPNEGELIRVSRGAEKATSADGFGYWPFKVDTPERPEKRVSWDDPLLGSEVIPGAHLVPDLVLENADGSSASTEQPANADDEGSDRGIPF